MPSGLDQTQEIQHGFCFAKTLLGESDFGHRLLKVVGLVADVHQKRDLGAIQKHPHSLGLGVVPARDLLVYAKRGIAGIATIEIRMASHPDPSRAPYLRGSVQVYGTPVSKRVVVSAYRDQNVCWKRATLCKELMHLLIDEIEDMNPDAEQNFTAARNWDDANGLLTRALTSEAMARCAAIEYMMPHSMRTYNCPPSRFEDVARRFRIPKEWVEAFYCSEYHRDSRKANEHIQQSVRSVASELHAE